MSTEKPTSNEGVKDPRESNDSQDLDKQNNPQEELEKVKKERDEYVDHLKRLQADFINYKTRMEKGFEEIKQKGKITFIQELLQILDNFDLAFNNEQSEKDFKKGVELIYAQIKELLQDNQITELDVVGEIFNPNLHQAIMTVKNPEKKNNEIVEVFQKGYKINDQVLRHAKVKVNKIV